ncbi:MAG TPA: MFS transporter [Gaiellaceae bacterium]|nr:MFS transporter [Gaiellaceae bacterium]
MLSRIKDENRKWWTLGAVTFSLFMVMLDNTIVNVALPTIGRDLAVGVSQLEWVVNGYTLTFAVLMLTGGRLADLYGRRLVFEIGLALFTLSSLACGLSSNAETLIAARAFQGAGAALMMPATLSIISAAFPHEERGTAIGIWAGVSGSALAIGPLLGGLLTEHVGWNWIFFVNVPVGTIAFVASFFLISESHGAASDRNLDVPGLLTSGGGLLALTYALIEANTYGWGSTRILTLFGAAAVLLTAFVLIELDTRQPLLDLHLFGNRTFTGANVAALLVSLAMFGIFFFVSLYMQNILGYSPVHAGVVFLPMTFLVVLSAPISGRVTDAIGPRWPITVGMLLLSVALVLFSHLGVHAGFFDMLPGMLVGGLGMGIAMGPMTVAALGAVPVERAGVASGVLTTSRQVGGTLGIAVMGAIVAAAEVVPPADPRFPLQFVDGFQHALEAGAAIALIGAVLSAVLIGRGQPAPASLHAAGRRGVGPLAAPEAPAVGAPDPVGDDELLVR